MATDNPIRTLGELIKALEKVAHLERVLQRTYSEDRVLECEKLIEIEKSRVLGDEVDDD